MHRPRLFRDIDRREPCARRDPDDRARYLSWQGLLGKEAADRLRTGVQSAGGGVIRQDHVCIAGVLRHGAGAALEPLLSSMNGAEGQARPDNELVPFGVLDEVHVARLVILDDPSLPDREIAPVLPVREPIYLAF